MPCGGNLCTLAIITGEVFAGSSLQDAGLRLAITFISAVSKDYLKMQLPCQQRNWFLIAALLVGDESSSFIDVFFKTHGEVAGLADGGAKPPDYPDYSPARGQSSPDPSHRAHVNTCCGRIRSQHPSLELG